MPGTTRPLRVAVLARSVYPMHAYGGLERHVHDLVRCLLAREVRVTLVTPPARRSRPIDPAADAVFRDPRLTLVPVPYQTFPFAGRRGTTILDRSTAYPWFGWRAGRVAARLAEAGTIDLVHGLGASALGYALAPPAGTRRVPFVFNPQGLEEFGATDPGRARLKRVGYWPLRLAVRACARAADRVIATDRALVAPVLAHLPIAPDVVRVIPNAIELAESDRPDAPARGASLRAELGLGPTDVLLLSVGRLEANKGFGDLVRALATLAADGPLAACNWRWVLVGDGPMRSQLQSAVAALGLGAHVRLSGRADDRDLHAWYEAATLFVHPTLYEGSSLVTLEAMAHRRAVVATRAGGLPDKIAPGINGWLVPPGDVAALGRAIGDALSDTERLASMGWEGRKIVEREFSW
ncbi:MAG: glycosyltransferase family 4 protein, partial [Acidobacteriota bacterium]